ncbi:MAG: HNH endonuclease [Gammaproteobacteria bacterium AqS3]|nr:HNH endonuclease [Gammaproteobacteria bacterium AqS3]
MVVLRGIEDESVDLIYLDPPFNTKRIFSAPIGSKAAGASFKDMWTWDDVDKYGLYGLTKQYPHLVQFLESIEGLHGKPMMSYCYFMFQRIVEMHRVLKPTGSIYLHCDPTASHYLKLVMDSVFGQKNFLNEIVWGYRTGGASKKWFGRKHDIILSYSVKIRSHIFNLMKERSYCSNNQPPGFKGVEKWKDEFGRWYTMASMRDVWEIDAIGRSSSERTGYPTQKPLELLRRIIKASSNEGDLVLDPFCGCATTCVAAEELGRKWIGIDVSEKAGELVMDRLHNIGLIHNLPAITNIVPTLANPVSKGKAKPILYAEQNGRCNHCGESEALDKRAYWHVDHIVPKKRGGQDQMSNYQLLCMGCNNRKSSMPDEWARAELQRVRDLVARNTFSRAS